MSIVAAIQLTSGPNIQANLYEVALYFEELSKMKCKFVVLPENFALMPEKDNDFLKYAENVGSGIIQDFLSENAKKYKFWIVGGTIPIKTKNQNKLTATTFVYNDKGQVVCKYNKIHLFDVKLPNSKESYNESKVFNHGKDVVVLDTPLGTTGLVCCYDLRFPEIFRLQHKNGVQLYILPAAFTEQTGKVHWETLVKARAIENLSYMITACQGGYHMSGRKTFGHTMIVNPWGQVLSKIDDGKGFITAKIDLKQLTTIRKNFPVLEHIRLFKN
ncbi:MAG: acyltransferase [Gammaproteobacteria bacterium]|nr:acyltransferase [Gammaproteobacteria bacterium]|tara:strand:- start:1270 stop:2088 length:819 start_codon:yes stop_codon:yes gene_type:complete